MGINGCKFFAVRVNLFQCAFVPAGSICVGNFELPRSKGRGRGGGGFGGRQSVGNVCEMWCASQRGALDASCSTINLVVEYLELGEKTVRCCGRI